MLPFFEIDAHTGKLTFKDAPDFENPQSGGGNNTYDVTVTVSDGNGGAVEKALWVKVKDVDEGSPTGGECIVIEAEDMHEVGFRTVSGAQASGGKLIKLNCAGGDGDVWTTFNGADGAYDMTLRVQDESDGQSIIMVKVNGAVVGTIKLDGDNDGRGSDHGGFSSFTLDDLVLRTGDKVSLWVDGKHGEFVRLDKIELCKDGEICPDGFSLQDFEAASTGAVVANQFDGFSVTAQRTGDGAGSPNDAMIFDSANPTGGDHDLRYAKQGNIIIISEDGDSTDPDDNANGGTITFTFDFPSDLHDIKLLDIEETGGTIDLCDIDGNLIKTVAIPAKGNNSLQTVLLDAQDVAVMKINLVGSGAVDDLCFKPGTDPGTASLGDKVFYDLNGNGQQDDGEQGVGNVEVTLINLAGGPDLVTNTTDGGEYLFENLDAGSYQIQFGGVDNFVFTTANQGDDATDSDADATGLTGTYTLAVGEANLSVDAGLVAANNAPVADDDAGKGCADEDIRINVLEGDTDADAGDTLTVTAVNGIAITEGGMITIDGVEITLSGGELIFNGEDRFAALDIGEEALVTYEYTITDGEDTDTGDVAVTFCGDANSIESLAATLPATGQIQVIAENSPLGSSDEAFTLRVSGTGDARIDGIFEQAYCVANFDPLLSGSNGDDITTAPIFDAAIYAAIASDVPAGALQTVGINGELAVDNLDIINWILNQDFNGQGYTDGEIQAAIWSLTDGETIESFGLPNGISVAPGGGDNADALEILELALANGDNYEVAPDGIVGIIIDPNDPAFDQPFIFGLAYENIDCIC